MEDDEIIEMKRVEDGTFVISMFCKNGYSETVSVGEANLDDVGNAIDMIRQHAMDKDAQKTKE